LQVTRSIERYEAQLHLQIDLPEKKIVSMMMGIKALVKAVRPRILENDPSNNKTHNERYCPVI